jgi:hypothetical protein
MRVFKKCRLLLLLLAVLLPAALVLAAPSSGPARPATGAGIIAYVRPNDASGDQIRRIAPDGSGDGLIWSTGQPDPYSVDSITALAWRPDAGELAFASDHEKHCSILRSDVYGVQPNGSGLRRITNGPRCDELAAYPKGTVVVEVEHQASSFGPFLVYVQGAAGLEFLPVAPGSVATLTVPNVADLGPGILQYFVVTDGERRWWGPGVDVQAGQSRTTPRLVLGDGLLEFGAAWPTWRHVGSQLGYVVGLGTPFQIGAQPAPLQMGNPLLSGAASAIFVDHLAWSPAAGSANQLLYAGSRGGAGQDFAGVFRITAGAADPGEMLVTTPETWDQVSGLAWLPDGSGFIFAMSQDTFSMDGKADIYEYRLATGSATRLTNFTGEFARQLTVSPDGERIVFERATALQEWEDPQVDLWIMNRDGSGLALLVRDGRAPAWSPGDPVIEPPPPPPSLGHRVYLPLLIRP